MVKAEVFWDYFCNTMGFRFFAGVPCKGLIPLYNKMSSSFMHYVPAANEQIAISLSVGAFLAGQKSASLMDVGKINRLDLNFTFLNTVSLTIIASGECSNFKRPEINLIELPDIFDHMLDLGKGLNVLFIEEGVLQ